jgi:hypothetical protein
VGRVCHRLKRQANVAGYKGPASTLAFELVRVSEILLIAAYATLQYQNSRDVSATDDDGDSCGAIAFWNLIIIRLLELRTTLNMLQKLIHPRCRQLPASTNRDLN